MKKEIMKQRVLIADDDPDMLQQLTWHLNQMGFEVLSAASQEEAEELLKSVRPDIALFDLMMENKDSGFILSYHAKKRYPGLPVVIITAVTAETGMVFSLDTPGEKSWIKADRYLQKNIRPEQLEREIRSLLAQPVSV
ncbi:MAG: hypothetical protein Kow00127_20910 [Bacteroidales bacterium]